ncbi:AcrR family transcriptional regulator [Lipingzhangella halophila]|uniref:AcrR family transcriptional regulator n=1 Tax=Lipingzhangella halophila TaxID=1783352 RepID=A0A7W7RET5_9ACTN|nr:TetR/AcrR family transcriptional regulator [Lipingzhangella halophila]MBB4930625.1 AcrR family transcriptional regulator [Lipingzhangella halophila]
MTTEGHERQPRRRPATRKGRPTLTRELIAERALELAGTEGFPAVTMRRLASELGVTVRALYNYVDDRQEVIELATHAFTSRWEAPALTVDRWETGLRDYCGRLRELYRRYPRVLLVPLDESVGPGGVHSARLRNPDKVLGLLHDLGIDPQRAALIHAELGLKLFAFALLVDYRADQATGPARTNDALSLPESWLAAHASLDVPHLTEAHATGLSPDAIFAHIIDTLLAAIRAEVSVGTEPGPARPRS